MADINASYLNLQTNVEERGSVAAAISAVVLIATDNDRRYFSIFNNSATGKLYIDFDNNPTIANAAFVLQPNQVYFSDLFNSGAEVKGIWDIADGQANVREYK